MADVCKVDKGDPPPRVVPALPPSVHEKDIERNTGDSGPSVANECPPSLSGDHLVDWDGPDDPENPVNWPLPQKCAAIGIVSAITFLSPLASSIFAPGISQVMSNFGSRNQELASLIVSVYVVGYCFGPLVIAPLSELYGRQPLYHVCNVGFLVFTIACAVAPNLGALVVFRLFAGIAGSCPMAIGPESIADLVSREKRGLAMSTWVFGPLLGPVIGPVAGGYLTETKGWRWSFWVLAIASGVITLLSFVLMRETYAYVILGRKTEGLKKTTGNQALRSSLDRGGSAKDIFAIAIVRPTKMLLFSPIVLLLSLYMFILYGYLYLIFTAMPGLYEYEYGFLTGHVGLTYLGIGAGSIIGLAVSATGSDSLVKRLRRKHGGKFKPEYRLPLIYVADSTVPIGLFWFGWTGETRQHWILSIIGTSFLGFGMTLAFMATSTYLVDAFGAFAASAVAANTVFRSLGGALLPLAGGKMFATLGLGWGGSLLAFIAVVMIPVPIVFYRYGERIRTKNLFNVKF